MTLLPALAVLGHAEGLSDLFSSSSSEQQNQFLPVEQAFQVLPSITSHTDPNQASLSVQFDISKGHYVYKDKLKLTLPTGISASPFKFNQTAHFVDDPEFGRVPVFDQPLVVASTVLTNNSNQAIDNANVSIGWQGCAKAGLCYPPEKVNTTVSIAAKSSEKTTQDVAVSRQPEPSSAVAANPKSQIDGANGSNNKPTSSKPTSSTESKATIKPVLTAPKTDEQAQVSKAQANQESAAIQSKAVAKPQTESVTDTTKMVALDDGLANDIVDINLANRGEANDEANNGAADNSKANHDKSNIEGDDIVAVGVSDTVSNLDNSAQMPAERSVNNAPVIEQDPFGLATHPWLALLLLFLAGLGLALTPCVLPMLPIVANIVASQSNPTVKKGLVLTSSYAVGVASAYGLLGAVIAIFGQSLGIIGWLQNPIILLSFAAVFVVLALYMLDIVPLRLPHAISGRLHTLSQAGDSKLGSAGGSLIAGFLSALVVSPCVSAPLFGALLAVSTIGNPVLGFAALFMLGFGLSVPLIILGATQGSIMPKAGVWMHWVKQGFALLLFAVALLLIERVFVSSAMLMVWALWFMVVAMWAWQWRGRGHILSQALTLLTAVWAGCLIVGAALGNKDSLHPLASLSQPALVNAGVTTNLQETNTANLAGTNSALMTDISITTLAQLDDIINDNPKVLVDVTADWCIECRIMDKTLFHQPPAAMADWQLVKLDITETSADSKAVLSRYQLFGPPALLYYKNGQLVAQQVGEVTRSEFEQTLNSL